MTPDEEMLTKIAADAEREIAAALQPAFVQSSQVFQTRPPVRIVTQPETPPEESPPIPLHDLLGLVIMTINDRMTDMEKMLDQRLTEIERVLGVKR